MDNYKPLMVLSSNKNDLNQVTSNPYENWKHQNFPFPYFIIEYISKTTKHQIYQKLTKTCKYFQAKEKKILVKELCFLGSENFNDNHYINISAKNNNISNLWITNTLICNGRPSSLSNHNSIETFIQKTIYKCDAKIINLWNQKLTLKEFDFLVNPNFVEQFKITGSKILKPDGGNYLVVEEIIEKIPNAVIIDLYDIPFSSKTSQNLLSSNHKVKIQSFSLYAVPNDFDIPSYCKFIDKNSARRCQFWMTYKTNNQEIIDSTSKALKTLHDSWDESRRKASLLRCY